MIGEPAPGPYVENGRTTVTPGQPVNVLVPGLSFKDNTVVVKAGQTVTMDVTNCTRFQHNFYSPGLNVNNKIAIPIADKTSVTFTAPSKPGTYMFWCTVTPPNQLSHAERGMTGEVIVQ